MAELRMATEQLDREGFWWRPSWSELLEGRRPEEHTGVNLASGNAAGNIGLLPFLTRTKGRLPCCPAAQLLDVLTSVLTQAEMRELLWRCVPRVQSSPFLHICSER